jgi:hypothetical protein
MEENKIQEAADSLREKAAAKKKNEKEDVTKERFKRAVSKRDEAMKKIYEYQDKTGVPSDDETSTEFLNNAK